jgi:glycine cleavage system H protein
VYLELPSAGDHVVQGQVCGEIESTKSVSDLYAAATGEIVEINEAAADDPGNVTADPYGTGWLFRIRIGLAPTLLNAADYVALTAQQPRR